MKKNAFLLMLVFLTLTSITFSQEQIVIAVLNFVNNTGDIRFDYLQIAIPEMLITNFMSSKKITLVERIKINHIFEEHKLTISGVIEEDKAIQIGKLIGANHLLCGSLFKSGTTVRLDGRVIDTSSGKIILSEKAEMSDELDFIQLIDELAIKIITSLTAEKLRIDYPEDVPAFIPREGKVIMVSCELDNTYRLRQSKEPSYVLINLVAGKVVKEVERVPLNICMVVDKSGSMEAENKLENVKKAALFVVDNLMHRDYFSLVTYDTHVYTSISSELIHNKENLKSGIREITSGSSTNLSGGLMEGYAQVELHFQSGYVNRVLLLTDGLANTGITNPLQLRKIVNEKNRLGKTLSTFGVGSDFNEDLLTTLAEYGGANYYFIHSSEKIADIFSTELQGLLSVVSQNATLEISLLNGVQLIELFGYSFTTLNNKIQVKLNDIFSEEKKSILVKLSLPQKEANHLGLGEITLNYDDVVLTHSRIKEEFSPIVKFTNDEKQVLKNKNLIVHDNIALFESTKLLDEAMTLIDRQDYVEAKKAIQNNLSFLQSNVTHNSSKRLKQQVLNVAQYLNEYENVEQMEEEDLKLMQKEMKFKNYLQKKKK